MGADAKKRPQKCGFCLTRDHDRCVGAVGWYDRVWPCSCCGGDDAIDRYRRNQEIMMAKAPRRSAQETHPTRTPTPKTPKEVTRCLVTGRPTRGGKFAPGMDARYISERVAEVMSKDATEAATKRRIREETGSEKLVEKFSKSLDNARQRAAAGKKARSKVSVATPAAKAQKSGKTAKASKARTEKAALKAVPDVDDEADDGF